MSTTKLVNPKGKVITVPTDDKEFYLEKGFTVDGEEVAEVDESLPNDVTEEVVEATKTPTKTKGVKKTPTKTK